MTTRMLRFEWRRHRSTFAFGAALAAGLCLLAMVASLASENVALSRRLESAQARGPVLLVTSSPSPSPSPSLVVVAQGPVTVVERRSDRAPVDGGRRSVPPPASPSPVPAPSVSPSPTPSRAGLLPVPVPTIGVRL